MDKLIQPILEKALAGQRLNFDDSLSLFRSFDLISIGNAADQVRQRHHPNGYVTYIVDRNINYTNLCYVDCDFCAFYRHKTDPDAYVMSREELGEKIEDEFDDILKDMHFKY